MQATSLVAAEPTAVDNAYRSVPSALAHVNRAIHRLSLVRSSYLRASSFLFEEERRWADWHFKTHKARNPVAQIDRVLAIYHRMQIVLNGAELSRLFQAANEDVNEVAHTHSGGYEAKPDELDRDGEPLAYIYIQPSMRTGNKSLIIVHELAHYCGGREGTGHQEIDHRATPIPNPKGNVLERGRHDYMDMTPDEAFSNTHSYQCYAFPEIPSNRIPDKF